MKKQNVAIVGAGLIGQLTAWRLAVAGHQVTLFERAHDLLAGCSWAGAGMLTPFAELEKAEPHIAAMGLVSLDLWATWLPQLQDDVYFRKDGALVVAHRQDMRDLNAFEANVRRKLAEVAGGENALQNLKQNELATLEPELAGRFDRAIYFAGEGHLDPRQLLPALQNQLIQENVVIHFNAHVTLLEQGCITINGEQQSYDLVVDTRGLGGRPQQPQLRGVRGELLRLHAPEVNLKRPIRLMHPRYPLYIAPRPNQHFLVGATSIESDDQGALTVKSALELLSAAYSLHSGFAEARVVESQVQCRPAYPSNNPALHYREGLLSINGLYRHGFLIAPAVVCDALRLIEHTPLAFAQLQGGQA